MACIAVSVLWGMFQCRLNVPTVVPGCSGKLKRTVTGAWFEGNAISWFTLKYDTQGISSFDAIHISNSKIHLLRVLYVRVLGKEVESVIKLLTSIKLRSLHTANTFFYHCRCNPDQLGYNEVNHHLSPTCPALFPKRALRSPTITYLSSPSTVFASKFAMSLSEKYGEDDGVI